MHWLITSVACLGRSRRGAEYRLELERADRAAAAVAVVDVWFRSDVPGQWDPAVDLVGCNDVDARAWLEAPEHEYGVAELCVGRRAA